MNGRSRAFRSSLLSLFVSLVLSPAPALAAFLSSSGRGTTTAAFLKLGAGARAAGMGEAFAAVADDAGALYWNPAAMTRVAGRSALFMHAVHLDKSFFDYGAFAQNLGRAGSWGVGFQYFSAGSIPQTDETGTETGSFTPSDVAVSAGYAYVLPELEFFSDLSGFSLGLAGKYVSSKILSVAKTGAVDLGLLSRPYLGGRLRFAATAANIGGRMHYGSVSEDLPLAFRVGSSYRIAGGWTAALDVGLPKDNSPFAALGTEASWALGPTARLSGRAGLNTRTLRDIDGFTGVSFGVGLGLNGLDFDYGLVPFGSVGLTHRVSVTLSF